MELEFQQIDRRYERLRCSSRERDGHVFLSVEKVGQQLPVLVVCQEGAESNRYILIDGYKRVRALLRLQADTITATCWDIPEVEALILEQALRGKAGNTALEQGWLLQELKTRFAMTSDELSRRFVKSPSWISGRLGLVAALPDAIQSMVQKGELGPHVTTRFLLPMVRRDRAQCLAFAQAMVKLQPTTRQFRVLAQAFLRGDHKTKNLLITQPEAVLRAREVSEREEESEPGKSLRAIDSRLCHLENSLAAMAETELVALRDALEKIYAVITRLLQSPVFAKEISND